MFSRIVVQVISPFRFVGILFAILPDAFGVFGIDLVESMVRCHQLST
jgi:hypothetical protein